MKEAARTERRVLVLASSLASVGGVQAYTSTFVSALREVLGADRVRVVAVPEDPELRRDGSVTLSLSVKIKFIASAAFTALSWSPDLIICAHVGLSPVARLVQKVLRVPYWLVLYGIEVWGDLSTAKLNGLRNAQRYLAITRFTLDAMAARHGIKDPQVSILPPTLPEGYAPPSEANRIESSRPTVLTVGRIAASERYKGHDVMLEAWPIVLRQVPDAMYSIVGSGDDQPRLESRAQELGIAESVRFSGAVSSKELDVCYDRCCVFAMPARTELNGRVRGEGFGIVFLEAMAHGKPVVGPRVGAPAEFIRSGEHGLLVDPSNPSEVAGALIELLQDPVRAQRMGDAGKQWVAGEFSFNRFCERLHEALKE